MVLVKTEQQAMALKFNDLMEDAPVDRRDFLIPKLLLMQPVSKLVQQEKARAGEIRGSIDQNKIAEREGSVEIIPFSVYKTWITLKKKGGEFLAQEPITQANVGRPREEIFNGEEVQHFETLNYYCLRPEELEGAFLPYVVSFRSTSYLAGKTLETHRAKLKEFGLPLCFKTFRLGVVMKKNDMGVFYAYTIAESRNSTEAELEAVRHWYNIVKQGVKVDESELEVDMSKSTVGFESRKEGEVREGDEY